MTDASSIGLRIKRARERKRWTQRQLAGALGVNVKSVDNWEAGRTSPRNSTGAIEEVLGISLDEGAQPPPGPFDDLYPLQEEWEEAFLADPALPAETKRQWITDSRRARAAHEARKQPRTDRSLRDPGRAAG